MHRPPDRVPRPAAVSCPSCVMADSMEPGLQGRKGGEGDRSFNQGLFYVFPGTFACKANPLPSPVTRVTITPTSAGKCVPSSLHPHPRPRGLSPIISLPLLLPLHRQETGRPSPSLGPLAPHGSADTLFPRPLPPRRQRCNLLSVYQRPWGWNLPSRWGTGQHTAPTGENNPRPEEGPGQ